MSIQECAAYLRSADDVLVLTHINPDGDTLGCAAALVLALRKLGKTAYVLPNPQITARYLPYSALFFAPDSFSPQCVVVVDSANRSRIQKNAEQYLDRIDVVIDHHPTDKDFAKIDVTKPEHAACGEIVLDIIEEMGVELDAEIATQIYIAVSTDTGCFSFDNTDGGAFAAAARCAEAGADVALLNRALFRQKTRGRVAVEGYIYSQMEFYCGGRAAVVVLSGELQRSVGADEDDLENLAAIPVSVVGVEVGIMIREQIESGDFRVSVRSTPAVPANIIARRFGGGGHVTAAGFISDKPVETVKAEVLAVLTEMLDA